MIKRATQDDAVLLAHTGVHVLNDLPNYKDSVYDIEHTLSVIKLYLDIPGVGCFYKEVDGEVVGLFLGIVAAPWFTPEPEMSEIMFWVREDYRRTSTARELIKTMEQWATQEGAKKLLMAAGSGYETSRVEKFYNRLGYRTWALTTCKEV